MHWGILLCELTRPRARASAAAAAAARAGMASMTPAAAESGCPPAHGADLP